MLRLLKLLPLITAAPVLAFSGSVVLAGELTVTVQPEKEQYRVGEPVILRCVFSNESDEPTEVDFGDFEATNIWYVIGDGTPGAVTKSFGAYRGGGPMQWPVTLKPGEKCIRYSVLDMWYRSDTPGVMPIRLIVNTGGHWASGRFALTVAGRASPEDMRAVVNALAAKGAANHDAKGLEMMEKRSCDEAVFYALSYLDGAPPDIWEVATKLYQPGTYMRKRIDLARIAGPGGRRFLE
jgi:hypothetical protein